MKMIRKMTALLLALCVALGAVSCSTADQSWSAEKDGDRLPVGVYVYNLYAAISLAQTQDGVDTSANLLEQEIDGQPAEEWIRNEAMRMTKEIYYLRSELEARGIPLTDDEQTQAESLASSQWGYVPDSVKKYVSLDSFTIAYGELSAEEASVESMSEYKPFSIDIKYRDLNRKPTYILIVCSSSKYGDYFVGGVGSCLLVDEFNLEFGDEPKVKE